MDGLSSSLLTPRPMELVVTRMGRGLTILTSHLYGEGTHLLLISEK